MGSRAVRTEIVGPAAMMSFGLNSDAVRHEVWRLRLAHLGKPTTRRQHHRWRETCKEWNWTHVEDTIDSDKPPRHDLTPEGVVDLAGDSHTTIKGIAKRSYMARVWGQEKRANDPDAQSQLKNDAQVECQALKTAYESQTNGRVATGQVTSHHALRGMRKRAGLEEVTLSCVCGAKDPSAKHWMHECDREPPDPRDLRPRNNLERCLPVRILSPLPRLEPEPEEERRKRTSELADAMRTSHAIYQIALVGTDGGVTGRKQLSKRAAWSVAVEKAPHRYFAQGGLVRSMDHSTAAAEREAAFEAAFEAVKAAHEAQCPIHLFIDNLAVQREVDKCFRGIPSRHWRHGFDRWKELADLASTLPPGSRAFWVPSHCTHCMWRPTEPYEAERIRALTDAADNVASKLAAEAHRSYSKLWDDAAQDAQDSCACAIQRLAKGERMFLDMYLPVKEEAPRGRRDSMSTQTTT